MLSWPPEVPTLDGAGVALTFRSPLHIDDLACFELIYSQLSAHIQITDLVDPKFPQTRPEPAFAADRQNAPPWPWLPGCVDARQS